MANSYSDSVDEKMITFVIPGSGEDVPEGKELLDFESRYGSTGHPVLDSGDVEDDLSLEEDTVSRAPVSDVFNVATEDVFSVRGDDDPPE